MDRAAWFWSPHGCNALADVDDMTGFTRRINGGLSCFDDRLVLYAEAVRPPGLGAA